MKSRLTIPVIALLVLLGCAAFWAWDRPIEQNIEELVPKINGVCFAVGRREIAEEDILPVKNLGAEWICLMPFAFSRADSAKIWFDVERQWWGEKTAGIIETVRMARAQHLKIMIKPHLWIRGADFTGHFGFEDEQKWKLWEKDFETYVLHFARLADSLKVEMYCMGTELERFTQERPQFWKSLIEQVREVYSGKLTYAANWDEYTRFPYWEKLDYIGVDAYFPLCEEKNPSLPTLLKAWNQTYKDLESFSRKNKKPILFTEFGYRSVDYTTQKPWESYTDPGTNLDAQSVALDALLQKFSTAKWHAGGFLWKWFNAHERAGGPDNKDYSPQNKPAEEVIRKWYTKTLK